MGQNPTTGSEHEQQRRGWGRTFESLSERRYRLLFVGSLFSHAAMQMTQVARPWLAYEVSGSALALGLVAAGQGLPMMFLSPLGGVAADRLPKRFVLLGSQFVLFLTALTLLAIVYFDVVQVWQLFVIALVHGSTIPFNQPVRQSYVPVLLPRDLLANGMALSSATRNLNQVLAPSVVGVLLWIEPFVAFIVIVGLHIGAMTLNLRLPRAAPREGPTRSVGGDLIYGLKYVVVTPELRTLVIMALIAVAFGLPYLQMLPVFQLDVLQVNEARLGLMYTANGLGGLVASLVVASYSDLATKGYPQIISGVAFGAMLAAFALSPFYFLSVFLLFWVGFSNQSYMTMNNTLMMMKADRSFYGRISSVNMMTRSLFPLALVPLGALADMFGAPATLATSGALLVGGVLLISVLQPSLWRTRVSS